MTEISTTTATETTTPAEEVTVHDAVAVHESATDNSELGAADEGGTIGAAPQPTEEQQAKKPGVRQMIAGLEAQLQAAHAQTFDSAVQALGLQPPLMRAAGLTVADYVREDGTVDTEALTVAADAMRAELGLPRKPLPNPVAGVNQGREAPVKRSLGEVLKSVSRPA